MRRAVRRSSWLASLALAASAAMLAGFPLAGASTASRGTARASGVPAGQLLGVSCTSPSFCMAVGTIQPNGKPARPLAERWNGAKWSVVSTPKPTGVTGAALAGVACTSPKNCFGVGTVAITATEGRPLVERWNGTTWSLARHVPSPPAFSTFAAVACTTAAGCWATGSTGNDTLVEHWHGGKWKIVASPSPNPGNTESLDGVACPAAGECWAVGITFPASAPGSLTERWNGSKWRLVTTPSSKNGDLMGDACASRSACIAVGSSKNEAAIAQRWNGARWRATAVPKPAGAVASELAGTACTSKSACIAVGDWSSAHSSRALTARWNGSAWRLIPAPAGSSGAAPLLLGVSCPRPANCWAVGTSFSAGQLVTLIEHWNGSKWVLVQH
jgi:hypothetical protein